ncbi:MAG TPA: CDP-alcohol phosphatidyltransferase family protein [Polyangia bacterium]
MSPLRFSIGPFGIKDLFTVINVLGGVAAVILVIDGRPQLAGVAVFAGYLFGDALDGMVARATGTSNKFGSEFDTATDHFAQAIVPAVIVFGVYAQLGHRAAGAILMGILVVFGTIRQALFSVARIGDPLMYCGLPRTVSGYACMSLVLSRSFAAGGEPALVAGSVVITALALMGILPIPYMTHRGARRMQTYVKILVFGFLLAPPIVFFAARPYTFDVIFVFMFGYALLAWLPLSAEERARFRARYREWAVEVRK